MTTKTEHPHAWALRGLADGTLKPEDLDARRIDWTPQYWCQGYISWVVEPDKWQVRRKQQYVDINGYQVPEPVREPLMKGEEYWTTNVTTERKAYKDQWNNSRIDYRWLREGLIHRTQEAAELHREALLSFTIQEKKDE